MQRLEDCLVEAICLNGELNDSETSLLTHLLIDFAYVNDAEVVFGVVLKCTRSLFLKHVGQGRFEFSLALLLEGIVEIKGGVNIPKGGALVAIYVHKLFEFFFFTHN